MTATSRLAGALLGALATTASFSSATAATPAAAPQDLGAAAATQTTRFNVYLPLTHPSDLEQLIKEQTDSNSPQYHQWLTPAQFKERFGRRTSDRGSARGRPYGCRGENPESGRRGQRRSSGSRVLN
jgi:hypothetical protein